MISDIIIWFVLSSTENYEWYIWDKEKVCELSLEAK